MRFYRGISVPHHKADKVVASIRANGLIPGAGNWRMIADDLKPRLDELWQRPSLTLADTRRDDGNPPWVCACAEPDGALYYACRHNMSAEDDAPILITFDADPRDVVVDGRDFLYTVFQLGDPKLARPIAAQIFGDAVLRYLDRAWATENQHERIALCDLAVQDDAVVAAHAANRTVMAGRYRTQFRSAFLVRLPVTDDRIAGVALVEDEFELPEVGVALLDLC